MHDSGRIGSRAASGALMIAGAQVIRVVTTLASTIAVARFLSPTDYGVAAMVAPLLGFVLIFQDLGLSQATIQAPTISEEEINALFWLNMLGSGVIALLLLAVAPAVSAFYAEPRAGAFTAASSLTVLAGGVAIQHLALLNRELRFRAIALVSIASAVAVLIATVVAAALLRSFWALWIGNVAGMVVTAILAFYLVRWRPSWRVRLRGSGRQARFGGALTGFSLLNFISRNIDNVLVARVWGAGPVGLYDRGYKLMMFPLQNINQPIARVMVPVLSRLVGEPDRYRRSYLRMVRVVLLATLPGIAVASATSDRLVPWLLGTRWQSVSPIFFWLSLAGFVQPIGNVTGWLFISTGRGAAMMRWGLLSSAMLITAFAIGVQWGPVGVAAGYFVGSLSLVPPLFYFCTRDNPVRPLDLYGSMVQPMAGAGAAVAITLCLSRYLATTPLLIAGLAVSYALAGAAQMLTQEGRDTLRKIPDLFRRKADLA